MRPEATNTMGDNDKVKHDEQLHALVVDWYLNGVTRDGMPQRALKIKLPPPHRTAECTLERARIDRALEECGLLSIARERTSWTAAVIGEMTVEEMRSSPKRKRH